jgi:hypothetical protein
VPKGNEVKTGMETMMDSGITGTYLNSMSNPLSFQQPNEITRMDHHSLAGTAFMGALTVTDPPTFFFLIHDYCQMFSMGGGVASRT